MQASSLFVDRVLTGGLLEEERSPERLEEAVRAAFEALQLRPVADLRAFKERLVEVIPPELLQSGAEAHGGMLASLTGWKHKHETTASVVNAVSLGFFNWCVSDTEEQLSRTPAKLHRLLRRVDRLVEQREQLYRLYAELASFWDDFDEPTQLELCESVAEDKEGAHYALRLLRETLQEAVEDPRNWSDAGSSAQLRACCVALDEPVLVRQLDDSCYLKKHVSQWRKLDGSTRIAALVLLEDGPAAYAPLRSTVEQQVRQDLANEDLWKSPKEVELLQVQCALLGLEDDYAEHCLIRDGLSNWSALSVVERVAVTKTMCKHEELYSSVLDELRKEVFQRVREVTDSPSETLVQDIQMLQALASSYMHSVEVELFRLRSAVLTMLSKESKHSRGQRRQRLQHAMLLLGIDGEIRELFQSTSRWKGLGIRLARALKGKTVGLSALDQESAKRAIRARWELRRRGVATEISHIPDAQDLGQLQLVQNHLEVVPSSVPRYEGYATIGDLIRLIRRAEWRGLLPSYFRDVAEGPGEDDRSCSSHLARVIRYLENDLNQEGRNIVLHYTDRVLKELASAESSEELDEVYKDVKAYILEIVGFSTYHCGDRKRNALRQVYDEKVRVEMSGASVAEALQQWIARRRDAWVSQLLIEWLNEHAPNEDVATTVGYWRHALRRELGLGRVPAPHHNLHYGVTRDEFLAHFRQLYTPQLILDWVCDEHNKGRDADSPLLIGAVNDLLSSRISNYSEIQYDLLNEEMTALTPEALALYLQEAGVYLPVC